MQSNTIQHSTVQYSTLHYNTIQYNTIQYNQIILWLGIFFVLPGAKITLRCGAVAIPWSGPPPTTAEENQLKWDGNGSLVGKISFVFLAVPWFS